MHIPKTAGQSIEHFFLRLLNLNWETRAALLLRYNDQPEFGPPRLAHLRAADYVRYNYIAEAQFYSYFRFSFVRNPWDRMVSFYKYLGVPDEYGFKTFAMKIFREQLWQEKYWFVRPQSEYLYEGSCLLVDFVGRFECLQDDFRRVCGELGIDQATLPHINQSRGTGRKRSKSTTRIVKALNPFSESFLNFTGSPISSYPSYEDYYDAETRALVYDLYEADIQNFGYAFERRPPGEEPKALGS